MASSEQAPVAWGIVGYGWVARDYMAPGIRAAGHRLVAVADPGEASRAAAEAEGARAYARLQDLVDDPEVEAVYVATPNHLHREAIEALAGEVEDRFGAAPAPVLALFTLARLRAACCGLGVARLSGGPQGVAADIRADRPLPPMPAEDGIILRQGRVVWRNACANAQARASLAADLLDRIRAARERTA